MRAIHAGLPRQFRDTPGHFLKALLQKLFFSLVAGGLLRFDECQFRGRLLNGTGAPNGFRTNGIR